MPSSWGQQSSAQILRISQVCRRYYRGVSFFRDTSGAPTESTCSGDLPQPGEKAVLTTSQQAPR